MKSMKSILLTIFFALVAFVYAAAIDPDPASSELLARAIDDGSITEATLPDGRRKIDIYDEGVFQGSLVETEGGGVQALDSFGQEINLDEVGESGDEFGLSKRASKWQIIWKFGKILKKWGKKAWDYIYCVGFTSMLKCGDEFLGCAQHGQAPWVCIEGMICVGGRGKKCAGK